MTKAAQRNILIILLVLGTAGYLFTRNTQLETTSVQQVLNEDSIPIDIPTHLLRLFPDTDFTKSDPRLSDALSGGPTKDGIPALDEPKFILLGESDFPDTVQSIVLKGKNEIKVYPYNILTLHEIINDTVDGVPLAITFCPLCGSAIVYNRTLPTGEVSTFGVSGSLLESNMIMYDRATENLWQQSTGEVLAGSHFPSRLEIVSFQLMNLGEVRETYPEAIVVSRDTGYRRNYDRNPYSGYNTNDRFIFEPSNVDTTFAPKTIMAVFRTIEGTPVTAPWLELRETGIANITLNEATYSLVVSDNGEMTISDQQGNNYPFYFEMWFSVSIQHKGELEVISI